jgi:hypothetical protein
MAAQMAQGSPIMQDPANYAGAGLNMFNTLLAGDSRYNDIRLQQAQQQAGGLAATGDYDAARNSMLAQGYPGQAIQYQGLAKAAKTRQDESDTADLNSQAGGLLAAGRRQEAAGLLYKAGRLQDAQTVINQGQTAQEQAQTAQKTALTQQAGAAAAKGEWNAAVQLAYQAGDIKAAEFYQGKAQDAQKGQIYQDIGRTQAIRNAAAAAKTPEDYNKMHDALVAAGYPAEVVDKYRDFNQRDQHLMELDAHKEDLTGRLAPEDREKLATSRGKSETALRTPEQIAEGRKTGTMLAEYTKLDAAKKEWEILSGRLSDPENMLAEKDSKGNIAGQMTTKEFEGSIGRNTASDSWASFGGIPWRENTPWASEKSLAASKFLVNTLPITMERLFQQIQPNKGSGSEADRERIVKAYKALAGSSSKSEYLENLRALRLEMNSIISGQEAMRESLKKRAAELNASPGASSAGAASAPAPAAPGGMSHSEGDILTNPDTGERVQLMRLPDGSLQWSQVH